MPGFVGSVQILTVGTSGVFNIGDVYQIKPRSTSKTFSGAGSFNTGEQVSVYNQESSTNTIDNDKVDSGNNFNL